MAQMFLKDALEGWHEWESNPIRERLVAAAASPLTLTYVLSAFASTRSMRRDRSRRQAVSDSVSRSN